MRLFLLRHGQTIGDIEGRFGGSYDDDLSDTGREQVKLLSMKLRGKEISNIYTSNLRRAKQTSDILANILNSEVIVLDNLAERNFYGVLSGLTIKEAEKSFPDQLKKMNYELRDPGIQGQEKYLHFKSRIIKTFDTIIKEQLKMESGLNTRHRERAIAIVTHAGPIRCIFREALGGVEFEYIKDCAIIELKCSSNHISIISIENAKFK